MKTWVILWVIVTARVSALAADSDSDSCIVAGIPNSENLGSNRTFACVYQNLPEFQLPRCEFPDDALLSGLPPLSLIGSRFSFNAMFVYPFGHIGEAAARNDVFDQNVAFEFSTYEAIRQSQLIDVVSRAAADFFSGSASRFDFSLKEIGLEQDLNDSSKSANDDQGKRAFWVRHLYPSETEDSAYTRTSFFDPGLMAMEGTTYSWYSNLEYQW
jgi:hypothetical protein